MANAGSRVITQGSISNFSGGDVLSAQAKGSGACPILLLFHTKCKIL